MSHKKKHHNNTFAKGGSSMNTSGKSYNGQPILSSTSTTTSVKANAGSSQFASTTKKYSPPCHTGNTIVGSIGEGKLYCGGWTRGAKPGLDWAVIDLADTFSRRKPTCDQGGFFSNTLSALNMEYGPVLSLYIQDFDTPRWGIEVWDGLTQDVREMMESGRNVLVACTGGHGRTGMVVAILGTMLGLKPEGEDPVMWIRRIHCEDAIETWDQEEYVYQILGLPSPERVHQSWLSKYGDWRGRFGWEDDDDDFGIRKSVAASVKPATVTTPVTAEPVVSECGTIQPSTEPDHKVTCRLCGITLDTKYGDDLERKLCCQCVHLNDSATPPMTYGHPTDPTPEQKGQTCWYCGITLQEGDYYDKGLCLECHDYLEEKGLAVQH